MKKRNGLKSVTHGSLALAAAVAMCAVAPAAQNGPLPVVDCPAVPSASSTVVRHEPWPYEPVRVTSERVPHGGDWIAGYEIDVENVSGHDVIAIDYLLIIEGANIPSLGGQKLSAHLEVGTGRCGPKHEGPAPRLAPGERVTLRPARGLAAAILKRTAPAGSLEAASVTLVLQDVVYSDGSHWTPGDGE